MTRQALIASVVALMGMPASGIAAAQTSDSRSAPPPAHVSAVEGSAVLERDGRPDAAPASMPLLAGDRLRTENGRVEVMFGDGSLLYLDTGTTVDFQSEEILRLTAGRIRLTLASGAATFLRVDTPGGWVQIDEPGDYRIAADASRDGDVELAVLRGRASLLNDDGRTDLQAGERAFARAGLAPSVAYVFNSAALDAFDAWAESRHRAQRALSVQYLPETVRPYAGTFDRYGSWDYEPAYGYVWYPTVDVAWRPYYRGRWITYPSFGWTWIGSDPWAWPTHHYGRWGVTGSRWFWIPGRQWGPAWVSWAYAPSYVSWCPLGFDNRAVVAFNVGGVYGRVAVGHGYNPWRAWTVLPAGRFGVGYVHTSVVAATRLDTRTRSSFVVRSRGPEIRGYAVPRSATPLYVAGGRSSAAGRPASASTGFGGLDGRGVDARPPDARATADFRSRGQQVPSTGPGLPAPARAPRAPSVGDGGPPADAARATPRNTYDARGAVPVSPRRRPGDVTPPAASPGVIHRAPSAGDPGPAPAAPSRGNIQSRRAGGAVPQVEPGPSAPRSPYDARSTYDARGTYEARGAYDARRAYQPGAAAAPRGGYDARGLYPAPPAQTPGGSGTIQRPTPPAAPPSGRYGRAPSGSAPAPAPRGGAAGAPARSSGASRPSSAPAGASRPSRAPASAPAQGSGAGSRSGGQPSGGRAVSRGGRGGGA